MVMGVVVMDMVFLEMKVMEILWSDVFCHCWTMEIVETMEGIEKGKFVFSPLVRSKICFQPVGPFKEGDPLTIMCVATGGEPPPSVLWYKENQIIDRWEELIGLLVIYQQDPLILRIQDPES